MIRIRKYVDEERRFFANSRKSIMVRNNRMLIDGCVLYALILMFYTIFAVVTEQPALLRNMYYMFDGIHLLLCIAVFMRPPRWKGNFLATQLFCVALEITILSFFVLEGTLTSPTQHSLYVPIAILLVQLLFIHGVPYSTSMILLYTGAFAVLSRMNKTPEAYTNDFYIALATFLSANIGYMLIAKMRRGEQQALTKYENLSRMDMLTGLYNKATMEEFCQRAIIESDRACTFIIIDLDDFKQINDEHGHGIGDEVLKRVGETIKSVFRANDIMGRFGGDEFIILMDSCNDQSVVRDRMNELQQSMEKLTFSIPELTVHYCAGIAFKLDNDDFHSIFSRADQALYVAKRDGKNKLNMVSPDCCVSR